MKFNNKYDSDINLMGVKGVIKSSPMKKIS